MKSVASSSKSFKCDCCDYTTNQSNNLSRHKKSKHSESQIKKSADETSDISENEGQPILNKDCHFCINYKQIIEMKDNRISELERQIELLQKDLQIAVLQTKLECKDVVLDISGNFIEKLSNIIQSQQSHPQTKQKTDLKNRNQSRKQTMRLYRFYQQSHQFQQQCQTQQKRRH